MKHNFIQAVVVSIQLYGSTTWMLTKHVEKELNTNCTGMLWAILNKSWKQHRTKQQLNGHMSPVSKTIQIRWTRHAGHCWKRKDKLISDVLLWTPSHECTSVGRPDRTYLEQLCMDTGCCLENLLEVLDDRDGWWARKLGKFSMTWRWWWYIINRKYLTKINCTLQIR